MKNTLILLILLTFLWPGVTRAQFMKDYQPAGNPLVTSIVNLVSVVESNPLGGRFSRSINTIQESATVGTNDVWVHNVDSLGNVTFSRRYGLQQVNEVASALIRCPNGDFIYAATTNSGGTNSAWLFRRGAINWSFRYFAGNISTRALCIKKTNEAVENYIVAGTYNNDNNLLVFKISGGGIMAWNRRYADAAPPAGLTDIPKSMLLKGDSVIIVGNRSSLNAAGAPVRDIFLIGVNQLNGNITHPYRIIDNGGRDDLDPFINFGVINNEHVLTYQTVAAIGGVNTGRVTFTRLNAVFNLAVGASNLYWETNNTNSFGHTIYKGISTALGYDIGGGTTIPGNIRNPIFFTITPTGAVVGGTYRRLWTTLDFNSTYMMQDAFSLTNKYEHHNWKRAVNQNSMSLLRNPALPAPCNVAPVLNLTTVATTLTFRSYTPAAVITQTIYNVPDTAVHGVILICNSPVGGVFKTGESKPVFGDEQTVTGAFKTYPTPLRSGEPLRIQLTASGSEPSNITVFNTQAQVMYRGQEATIKGTNLFTVNTSGFKPGTYIVEVKQGAEAWRNKIVVE